MLGGHSVKPLYGPQSAQERRLSMHQWEDSLPLLIGIGGASGSGKDVVASYLVKHHGYTRLGFSDALKEEVSIRLRTTLAAHLLDIGWVYPSDTPDVVDQGIYEVVYKQRTPLVRCLLQEYGTDIRRRDDSGYWVRRWSQKWHQIKSAQRVVVPDVRFENECTMLREYGALLLRVIRPKHQLEGHAKEHASERLATHDGLWDYSLQNTGTLAEFYEKSLIPWISSLVDRYLFEYMTQTALRDP